MVFVAPNLFAALTELMVLPPKLASATIFAFDIWAYSMKEPKSAAFNG